MGDNIIPPKGLDNGVNPQEGGCKDVASMKGGMWADQKTQVLVKILLDNFKLDFGLQTGI